MVVIGYPVGAAARAFIVFMGRFLDTRTGLETGKIARA